MAHEAVVEHFLKARAVLPMQLFTLFTTDERALSHVTRHARRIERVLARVERQLEWGVRLTFDDRAATQRREQHVESAAGGGAARGDRLGVSDAQEGSARPHAAAAGTGAFRRRTLVPVHGPRGHRSASPEGDRSRWRAARA